MNMLYGIPIVIKYIQPYFLPILMGIIALIVGGVCVVVAIKLVRRQVKLYNSITLVELKSSKIHYWVFVLIIGFFILYVVGQILDPNGPELELMKEKLSMKIWQCNLMLSLLIVLLLCIEFILVVLAKSKCAVVDRGIYTSFKYLDWYHVHNYLIDEKRGIVVLSSSKKLDTLRGMTTPLKVAKNDIAKLNFILNKNKNKFSGFSNDNF